MLHLIDGVLCYGIKKGKYGVGIIKCKGKISAVYTKNSIKSASIKFNIKNLGDEVEGVIVNSGNANAFTGKRGIENAKKMAEILAKKIGCDVRKIAVASTGVIGVQVDIDLIEKLADEVFEKLDRSEKATLRFAESIMTTDRYPKMAYREVDGVKIAGVAKGAGMISPNMATMLAFIITDAKLSKFELDVALKYAVENSFNRTVVDGDTSTNDTVFLISTSKKEIDYKKFTKALLDLCMDLAEQIASDGEGATKLMKVIVKGAKSKEDAIKVSKAIASSLLVKTALFGADPNFGRIVCAIGYSNAEVDECISIDLSDGKNYVKIVKKGEVLDSIDEARELLKRAKVVKIIVDLHKGKFEGYAIGCDLSYEYVRINSEYTT